MRPCALVPVKWRLPECARTILPVAVNLKRLAAPRCVFSFLFGLLEFLGIAAISPLVLTKAIALAARAAANLVLPLARPSWEPAAPPGHCLPCAASSRSDRARRSPPADASSSRGPLPGAPFHAPTEKADRARCH